MGTYLAHRGFTAQKPLRRAYEQSAESVQRWLRHDYRPSRCGPEGRRAPFSGATRPACAATTCAAAAVRRSHRRARLDLISALTNKGELRWMLLDGAIKAPTLIRFMQRLVEDAGRKVFLILTLQLHF